MLRNILLFLTAVLISLTAGRAFWVWLGESPFDMSGATYVEFFQQLDRSIALPIAITGVGGTLLAGLSAVFHFSQRRVFYLLIVAFGLGLIGCVVTVTVNVPINQELAHWSPTALPVGYEELLHRWWEWHRVRLIVMSAAMCLVFSALIVRQQQTAA